MASIYTHKSGQTWVQFYWQKERIQQAFRNAEDAQVFKAQIEVEIAKSRRAGKPTPILANALAAKSGKTPKIPPTLDAPTPARLQNGVTPQTESLSIDQAWQKFIGYKSTFVKPISLKSYNQAYSALTDHSDVKYIHELNRDFIIAFIGKLKSNMSNATVNNRIRHLKVFINWCLQEDLIEKDPFKTKLEVLKSDKKRKPYLFIEEVKKLLAAAGKLSDDHLLYIAIGCFAGLRAGEIHRLKWIHISNAKDIFSPVAVKYIKAKSEIRTWKPEQKERVKAELLKLKSTHKDLSIPEWDTDENSAPWIDAILRIANPDRSIPTSRMTVVKSKTGTQRDIPLSDNLFDILNRVWNKRRKDRNAEELLNEYVVYPEKLEIMGKNKEELINEYRFSNEHLVNTTIKNAKLETVNRHGEPQHITPHIFRYTFASLLLNKGEDPDNVRRYLGHTRQQMTDHYAYLRADNKRIEF